MSCLPSSRYEDRSVNGAQLFADKVTEDSAGAVRIALEAIPPWVPFQIMSKVSAIAHYCAPEFANIEPILGLSALPMVTATFDEAESLLRVARPYYRSALARHDQILLMTQPWRPVALWSTFRIRSVGDLQGGALPISSYVGENAGWGRTFIRLGARRASFSEAEIMLSSGYTTNMKFTQEFTRAMKASSVGRSTASKTTGYEATSLSCRNTSTVFLTGIHHLHSHRISVCVTSPSKVNAEGSALARTPVLMDQSISVALDQLNQFTYYFYPQFLRRNIVFGPKLL